MLKQRACASRAPVAIISPFQPVKENWRAATFLNCNCISPESPGRRLIEEIEFYVRLERADGNGEQARARARVTH
jgi:hypothetical protein